MKEEINVVRSLYFPIRTDQYPRMGHRIIEVQNKILIFGGLSSGGDFHSSSLKLDCETMTLDLLRPKNDLRLANFSLFMFEGSLYFWGGSGPFGKRGQVCTNKLLKFKDSQFITIDQKGSIPEPRENHCSCMMAGKYLIIMGGHNLKKFFNDWYLLDCSTMTWHKLKTKDYILPCIDSKIFWYGGRGFLLTNSPYDPQQNTLLNTNPLYEFRFLNFQEKIIQIKPVHISPEYQQLFPRGTPSVLLVPLKSPYLVVLGGSFPSESNQMNISNQVECCNLETLEWFTINSANKTAFAFQTLFSNDKIYLVGGLSEHMEPSNFIEYMELKVDYLQSKVCKVCRQVYGFRELSSYGRNTLSLKIEAQSPSGSFFNSQIIQKMAQYISYPFSAIGLLIDNSLNFSGTNIDIEFLQNTTSPLSATQPQYKLSLGKPLAYNFIRISDNSIGFSFDQIMQCLHNFSVKTQTYTSDKRYQDQIYIRKQYSINLKFGSMRLASSCLYITTTDDRSKLYAYFSVDQYHKNLPFTVTTYFITSDGLCSSEINRNLIKQNVKSFIPTNYQDSSATTLIYLFDMKQKEMSLEDVSGKQEVFFKQSPSKIFRELRQYLQCQYLRPFKGRKIAMNGSEIHFRSLLQIFKKDQREGYILRIPCEEAPQEIFNVCSIYKVNRGDYWMRGILCYHNNRLIFAVSSVESKYCGVVELTEKVRVDLFKSKIQNKTNELIFYQYIKTLVGQFQEKRVPKPGFKSLNNHRGLGQKQ